MSKIVLGFTGTRKVDLISDFRVKDLQEYLKENKDNISYVVHGGAKGADTLFHEICTDFVMEVHCRPAYKETDLHGCSVEHPPKKPLERNKDILDECDILIALPVDKNVEELRSGTWFTIRWAQRLNKQIVFI